MGHKRKSHLLILVITCLGLLFTACSQEVKVNVTDDSTNQPLSGASVSIDGSLQGVTAEQGSLTFAVKKDKIGKSSLSVDAPGYKTHSQVLNNTQINVSLTKIDEIILLNGIVFDQATNLPIAGARVTLTSGQSVNTNADGQFSLSIKKSQIGHGSVQIIAENYEPLSVALNTNDLRIGLTKLDIKIDISITVKAAETGEIIRTATVAYNGKTYHVDNKGTVVFQIYTSELGKASVIAGADNYSNETLVIQNKVNTIHLHIYPDEETVPLKSITQRCPSKTRGDGDFDGNGPFIDATVRLIISDNGRRIEAVTKLKLTENKSDWTTANSEWRDIVFEAPEGKRIQHIMTATESKVYENDTNGHAVNVWQPGGAAKEITVMGDTKGDDVGVECGKGSYISIRFNTARIRYER